MMDSVLENRNNNGMKSPVIDLNGINQNLITERIDADNIQLLQNSNFLFYKTIPIYQKAAPDPKQVLFNIPRQYTALLNEIRCEYIPEVAGTFQQALNIKLVHYSRSRNIFESAFNIPLMSTPAADRGIPRYALDLDLFLYQNDVIYIDVGNFDSTVTDELHIACRCFMFPTEGINN